MHLIFYSDFIIYQIYQINFKTERKRFHLKCRMIGIKFLKLPFYEQARADNAFVNLFLRLEWLAKEPENILSCTIYICKAPYKC